MFRFVTIIPFSLWIYLLLLMFMWAAFGLGGLVITVVGLGGNRVVWAIGCKQRPLSLKRASSPHWSIEARDRLSTSPA
jgi:hypothetical protein